MSAISTKENTRMPAVTAVSTRVPRRPSPLLRLSLTEAKLLLRERIVPIWGFGLPLILLVVFGSISSDSQPDPSLGGKPLMYLYLPVVILMGAALICLIASSGTLAGYRERGVLRRFGTTPAGATRLLAAQLITIMTLTVTMAALVMVVARLKYHVPVPAQFGGFVLALLLAILALMSIGLCIASVAKTSKVAMGLGALCFYPMMFFSGLWLPIPKMSPVLQDVSHATPLGSAVTAMSDALGGTFPPLGYLGIMAGWAIVTGLLARRIFRWE
jgi:ABC-2 type transport system permease protein